MWRALKHGLARTLLGTCLLLPACGPRPVDDTTIEWRMTPRDPFVGQPVAVEVSMSDAARGAALGVEAHMSHPGMAPVLEKLVERADGTYEARIVLTMSGDWVAFVTGALADGRTVRRRVADFTVRQRDE